MSKRWLRFLAVISAVVVVMPVAACGSGGPSQLQVTMTTSNGDTVKAGDRPTYHLSVANTGPGTASAVTARIDLPASLRLVSTVSVVNTDNAARTAPADPAAHSQQPAWGMWTLAGAQRNADGTKRLSSFTIEFTVEVDGAPGKYALTPVVSSAEGNADLTGAPVGMNIIPAPHLGVTVEMLNSSVRPAGYAHYRLTVSNDGSGAATGVAVTVTLPPSFSFTKTDSSTGSAGRTAPIDPVKGSLVPFWSGFSVPARSDSGPGLLVLTFEAQCATQVHGGTVTASVQVSDATGDVLQSGDVAALPILASPAPSPSASAHAGPSPFS